MKDLQTVYLARSNDLVARGAACIATYRKLVFGTMATVGCVLAFAFFVYAQIVQYQINGMYSLPWYLRDDALMIALENKVDFYMKLALKSFLATLLLVPALLGLLVLLVKFLVHRGQIAKLGKDVYVQWTSVLHKYGDEIERSFVIMPSWQRAVRRFLDFNDAEKLEKWERQLNKKQTLADTQSHIWGYMRLRLGGFMKLLLETLQAQQSEQITRQRVRNGVLLEELKNPDPGLPPVKD